jgi:hypothetical protein
MRYYILQDDVLKPYINWATRTIVWGTQIQNPVTAKHENKFVAGDKWERTYDTEEGDKGDYLFVWPDSTIHVVENDRVHMYYKAIVELR